MRRTVTVFSLLAVLLAACGGSGPGITPTPTEAPTGAPTATPAESPAAQTTPGDAPKRFAVGDVIVVTKDDEDWAEITVTEASTVTEYKGDFPDTPKDGNVYLQVFVHYKSLSDDASYNPLDWDLFVDNVAMNDFTFVVNGPEPTLGSGDLPKGREAEGWMVHEIPATGEAVLSWKGVTFFDDPPVFEVVVRES
jgi:hypothetical protein